MIVPYAYDAAYRYWYDLWATKQRNENAKTKKVTLPVREVHITPPQREPMKQLRKLFTFLNEEEDNE